MPVISTIAAATARAFGAFKAAAGGAADEFFNYVTLLLHGDGTNGAQNNTFLDSSTNNFTITRNGNTTQGTFSPFSQDDGKWGAYFDGSGDYLSSSTNAAFNFGSGDFTIEGWVNISAFPSGSAPTYGSTTLYASGDSDAATDVRVLIVKGSTLGGFTDGVNFAVNSTPIATSGSFTFNANQWYHIAVTRSSNSIYIFIDGVLKSTTSYSGTLPTASTYGPSIGATQYRGSSLYVLNGYASNVRVVKGSAVYTSNFTPSTTPLTAISGTSLLTCQSNRFKDNSSNAFAITVNGNTSIQPFSPFAPSAAYSAATNGGSGYFDGSGDYIQTPTSSSFTLAGTSDWQIDFWYYPLALPAQFSGPFGATNGNGIFFANRSGNLDFTNNNDNAGLISSPFPTINAWSHIVLVNRGSTNQRSVFINGVRTGTYTSNYTFTNDALYMTGYPASTAKGYLSNFRVQNGSRTFDPAATTLTVPSLPTTATGTTVLLLNFTNAGILDNTGRNDLETVGNAQISTSVKKFGTGSLAFDGTGDWLQIPDSENFSLGSGDWTIEMWVYPNSTSRQFLLYSGNSSGTNDSISFSLEINASAKWRFIVCSGSTSYEITTSASASSAAWTHIAAVRNGNTTTLYINGTSAGTVSVTGVTINNSAFPVLIGSGNTFFPYNGYIDDLRITKGVARYTSNFTPPTAAFEDQ